jgi:hypothetical protein
VQAFSARAVMASFWLLTLPPEVHRRNAGLRPRELA